jgi:hypothetical protein
MRSATASKTWSSLNLVSVVGADLFATTLRSEAWAQMSDFDRRKRLNAWFRSIRPISCQKHNANPVSPRGIMIRPLAIG